MGISIFEFDQLWYTNPDLHHKFDVQYDEYQQSLDLESKIILDSRLGFRNQPHAFKILLSVDPLVAAQRIFEEQRKEDANESLEHVLETNKQRREENRQAYIRLYKLDLDDSHNYNIVIDTRDTTRQEVAEIR